MPREQEVAPNGTTGISRWSRWVCNAWPSRDCWFRRWVDAFVTAWRRQVA